MTVDEDVLIEIRDLYTNFYTYQGVVKALDGINLQIRKGETFGLVGETGCGKSVTANCILRLIPSPPGKIEKGSIYFAMPNEKRMEMLSLESRLSEIRKGLSEADVGTIQNYFYGNGKKISKDKKRQIYGAMDSNSRDYIDVFNELQKLRTPYDLLKASEKHIRKIRGKYISMIFQEPMSSLNPTFTAGDQIAENILLHERKDVATSAVDLIDRRIKELRTSQAKKVKTGSGDLQCSHCKNIVNAEDESCSNCGSLFYSESFKAFKILILRSYRKDCVNLGKNPNNTWLRIKSKIPIANRFEKIIKQEARDRAKTMLELVRIPDPSNVLTSYPHELSGGMQQRVTIAMALACKPRMLIADEPTTALDVTIQAQILKLMNELQEDMGTSILLITHNLGVVAETCQRVGVMYAGNMAEIGSVIEIFKEPLHPYTQGLMNSIPKLTEELSRLEIIEGNVPNLVRPPLGCRFNPRCPFAMGVCRKVKPPLIEVKPNHFVSCHLYSEGS
ncbi:MAG: ABC transporter ATP-binding protein [Methanomassiliicoccales archaeon]|nr:ABC transporter ATP-binding protein [Methanomassiliicoccales archaeon]NYT15253.1 ABC transporter ATP-binding protein [Methanomassiliicoccales archaeon]